MAADISSYGHYNVSKEWEGHQALPCNLTGQSQITDLEGSYVTKFDLDMFMPNTLNKEIGRIGMESHVGLIDMLKASGLYAATCSREYGHFERGREDTLLTVGATTGGGAGEPLTFQLGSDSIDAQGNNAGHYARPGFIFSLMMAGDIVNAMITNVDKSTNPFTITVKPLNSACDLNDYFTEGTCLPITQNAFGPCSCIPEGYDTKNIRYRNNIQTLKSGMSICGEEQFVCAKVQFLNPDGTYTTSQEVRLNKRMEWEINKMRAGALWVGTKNNNVVQGDVIGIQTTRPDALIPTTQGMLPFIMQNGYAFTYSPGTWSMDDWLDIDAYLDTQHAPYNYIVCHGKNVGRDMQQAAVDYIGDKSVNQYTHRKMFNGCESLALRINYKSFSPPGVDRIYNLKRTHEFSMPNFIGGMGNMEDFFFMFPAGLRKSGNNKALYKQFGCGEHNPYSLDVHPMFGYRYLANKGYSRDLEFRYNDNTKAGPVTDFCDTSRAMFHSSIGFQGSRGNQSVWGKVCYV